MMRIAGIISTSTVDVPSVPVSVLFTAGCNFSCPYCHNFDICCPRAGYDATVDEIVKKLTGNILVEGVNITGGEPTLQPELIELVDHLRKERTNFVGIDSNGSQPDVIKQLSKRVNRFAIDFKVPWCNYKLVTDSPEYARAVQDTLAFLSRHFKGDLEVRTTVIRQFHTSEALEDMAKSLQEINFPGIWVLQEYQFSKGVNQNMKGRLDPWAKEDLLAEGSTIAKQHGLRVALRTALRGYEKVTI